MSSFLSAELSATCNALGTYDKKAGKYLIDDFTLNTVKDLIRYLRRDGEEHEIRRHFGETKVLQTDLLPMLVDHWENTELFDVTLRLLVNLTNPALLLYREEVPIEKTARHNYLQILTHLQSYKEEAFTKVENWTLFAKKLAKILEIDWSERDEDTGLIIERVLILIRNVLHVPADIDKERRPDSDASIHDQVLWALNQSGILDIILYMSSENEKQYFMHIIEIISHLLREQNPSSLADSALQRSVDEKLRDEQELLSIRMAENKQRVDKIKQYSSARHSRFGGTYVVQNMKSISDNELICLKPLNDISKINFSGSKKYKYVKPKNRRPVENGNLERRSAFAVRLFLKEFCIEFLNSSYNTLMKHVKDILVRAKAQQNDESYYLWAVKFFMEFNRGHHFQVGLVSETMSVPMFHYVQQQMENYYDMIRVEKKKFGIWVRRLHLALRAYKELLNTLIEMDKSADDTVKESSKVIKSHVFYVLEYREFILTTALNFDDNKMPRSYLVDLVETVHIFLKMLEKYCKKTGLVIQKRVKRKKSKKKNRKSRRSVQVTKSQITIPAWEEVRAQLVVVFNGGLNEYPPPFDAASDKPIDEQKEDCMKKIQKCMREHKYEDAVGTFRAAREVWPEEGIFGVPGIPEDEELCMMETIYNTDLGVEIEENNEDLDETQEQAESENEEEEEETEQPQNIIESDFDFEDFVLRFCHPRVASACVSLLERFDTNLPFTNHCIVKMMHRMAWDCKRPAMFFQGTLFITFQRILDNDLPQFKELKKFALYIIKQFTEAASKTPKVFIELLFWSTMKDCAEIQHGYDLYSDQRDKPTRGTWTEEQEEELRALVYENQRNPENDKDAIDWILDNLIDQTRTRRGVLIKLKELGLVFTKPTKKSNKERVTQKISKVFGEDEDAALKELWETYGDSVDPMGAIIPRMPRKRTKRSFVERLLELGLINDRKQCGKKRSNKSKVHSDSERSHSEDESSSGSDSDRAPQLTVRKPRTPKPKQRAKQAKKPSVGPTLSADEIGKLLINAVETGLKEPLKWLIECLEEVALDQEAEGFDPSAEGTPLVPIAPETVEAMANKTFKTVLKGIGVKPPSDEQEIYWRIPSNLHFNTIRKRCHIISKAVNGELVIENVMISKTNDKADNQSSDDNDDDLFENFKKITHNTDDTVSNTRKRSRSITSDDEKTNKMQKIDETEEHSNDSDIDDRIKQRLIRHNSIDSSDDVDNEINNLNKTANELDSDSDENINIDNSKKKIYDQNDSEDDDDILSFAKRTLQQDNVPDTEDILESIPRTVLDDDSSDEEVTSKKPEKRRRAIIDDDDSD